jgi:predicted GIY-YIG superfamily endonuclease
MGRLYTFDMVKVEALKYDRPYDFQKNSNRFYRAAQRHGWLKEVCSHMVSSKKFWTYEEVKIIISKCSTKQELRERHTSAYRWLLKNLTNEEFNQITSHLESSGNLTNRLIYSFEFPDNSVYIGLTFNRKKRFNEHMYSSKKSAVRDHMIKTGLKPIFKVHTDYIHKESAVKMEAQIESEYKKNGWNILNIAKTGSLGCNIVKWTKEEIQKEILKYKTKSEFHKNNPSAYNVFLKLNSNNLSEHMKVMRRGKYTYDELKSIFKKHTSLKDLRKYNDGAISSARRQGWYNELISHITKNYKRDSKWDFDKVKNEALKYGNSRDFRNHSYGAYKIALRNKWYDEIGKHFEDKRITWNYDLLKEESKKYKTKNDFKNGKSNAYQSAYRAGYLNEFFPKKNMLQ